jgi:hypothetical protein
MRSRDWRGEVIVVSMVERAEPGSATQPAQHLSAGERASMMRERRSRNWSASAAARVSPVFDDAVFDNGF